MLASPVAAALGRIDRNRVTELVKRLVSIPSPDPPGWRDEYVEIDKVITASRIFTRIALDYLSQSNGGLEAA